MRWASTLELLRWGNHNKGMGNLSSFFRSLGSRGLFLATFFSLAAIADSLAQRDFEIAKALYSSGKESEALVSFSDFLRRHPADLLADDAQFLMGEIYFHKRQFQEAVNEYRKVSRFQKGDRLADAYLRVGESQQRLGNFRAALIEFEAVRRRYPKGDEHDRAEILIEGLMKAGNSK
jgi:TolA-binding protein